MNKAPLIWISLCALWAMNPAPSSAVPGDVNRDGIVDFTDFFLLTENFGKTGPPESYSDTVMVERTVHDTVIVEHTVVDTLYLERTVRDTLYVYETVIDTVYLSAEAERSPIRSSWSEVVDEIEPAVYWIGYTAKPVGSTRYDVTFVGTGFAIDGLSVLTNYHVGSYIDDQLKNIRSDLEPVVIAVRAGTRVFGGDTYYLGTVDENRDLLGFWHPEYDRTVQSPDIALFPTRDPDTGDFAGGLDFVRLASRDDAMTLQTGDEIGILGFPGPLETNHSPYTLTPTPTFKRGTISAIRAFDERVSLTRDWQRALMGVFIQHDLDTSPGNSGSPLFNKRAEVIAIHNSGIPGGDALDFGIRADEIRRFVKALYTGLSWGPHINAKPVATNGPYAAEPYKRPLSP